MSFYKKVSPSRKQGNVGIALAVFLIDRLVYRMAVKVASTSASLEIVKDTGTVVLRT